MENYLVSRTKVYLDQPYVKIMWVASDNSIHVEWRSTTTQENYLEALTIQADVIKKHHCQKICLVTNHTKEAAQKPGVRE
jgi:hypothetical protein